MENRRETYLGPWDHGHRFVITPGLKDLYVRPLAKNRISNPDHNKTDEVYLVQAQKPSSVPARQANEPEGTHSDYNIPPGTMQPSKKHGIKSRIPQGIKIRVNHFPEEV